MDVLGNLSYRRYVIDLKENVKTLEWKAEELECLRHDIQRECEEGSRNDQRISNEVKKWLEEVDNIQKEISYIKTKFDKGSTVFSWSRYKLGKRVVKMLKDMNAILRIRQYVDYICVIASPPRVLEMAVASTEGHITAQNLEVIWGHLCDELRGIICVYGMGGIGKTTLMKHINNRLVDTQDFDVVIWITVSKDYNLESVQKEIMSRLGFDYTDNESEEGRDESEEGRSALLYDRLVNKKYLLILDDLWNEICLDQIGIPNPNFDNGSKIVITTRCVDVGHKMEADVMIEVKTLREDEAWNLFCDKVGKVALLPDIQPLAKAVVKECGGLPLAISVFGRAMRGTNYEEVWQYVLTTLRRSAQDSIEGMVHNLYLPLKLSYDNLEDNNIKACFLYCSLFPEGHEIDVDELVTYWVMEESIIDDFDNLVDATNKGHYILKRIVDACLLEKVPKGDKYFVKMHDLIRDLTIWITSSSSSSSSSSNQGPKFFVRAGVDLKQAPPVNMWSEVERISFMRNRITCLPRMPNCPNLVSLLMRESLCLSVMPSDFFQLMPALEILDLSYTSIDLLPPSLSSLVKLRALILRSCKKLQVIPLLGQLKELQFLDLSHTSITKLPQDMNRLVKLKKLDLSHLEKLNTLPQNVISRLTNLEDLRIYETNWAKKGESEGTLGELATLTHLTTLEISIRDIDCLVLQDVFHLILSTLIKFKISIASMDLNEIEDDLPCAKLVRISGHVGDPRRIVAILNHAEGLILTWSNVYSVSSLIHDSKSLRMIHIKSCNEMDCLIHWREVRDNALQNIEEFLLLKLPNLKQLFSGRVPWRFIWKLKRIIVDQCDKLKSLFSSEMVQHLDQLEVLHVMHCDELEEIIQGNQSLPDNPLPKLQSLKLVNLSSLTSIIQLPMLDLPALKEFHKESCPKLSLPECPSITDIQSENISNQPEALEQEDVDEISLADEELS